MIIETLLSIGRASVVFLIDCPQRATLHLKNHIAAPSFFPAAGPLEIAGEHLQLFDAHFELNDSGLDRCLCEAYARDF